MCASEKRAISPERLARLGAFGSDRVLGVGKPLEHLKRCVDAGLAKLAMDPHGQAEERSRVPDVSIVGGNPCRSP